MTIGVSLCMTTVTTHPTIVGQMGAEEQCFAQIAIFIGCCWSQRDVLLELSRLEAGKLELNEQGVVIKSLLQRIFTNYQLVSIFDIHQAINIFKLTIVLND